MKCPFCGTENIAGRTHCIACGTPLPIVAEPTPVAITEPIVQQQILPAESVATSVINNDSDQASVVSHVLNPQTQQALPSNDPAAVSEPVFSPSFKQDTVPTESVISSQESVTAPVSWLEPTPAPEPVMPSVPVDAVVTTTPIPEVPAPKVGEMQQPAQPRVNVHFDEKEVEEVQMPVHQESVGADLPSELASTQAAENQGGDSEPHTGPWLALTVLGGGLIIVILIIYFLYRLIFGGTTEQTVAPQPTVTVVPTPTVTATPIPQLSVNDVQRERDIDELKIALSSYYRDKQRYPAASTYNGLLNALIGGNYLTRRVQDPAFPGQEYKYTVDALGNSYEVVITFDTTASAFLQGSSATVYRLTGNQGN